MPDDDTGLCGTLLFRISGVPLSANTTVSTTRANIFLVVLECVRVFLRRTHFFCAQLQICIRHPLFCPPVLALPVHKLDLIPTSRTIKCCNCASRARRTMRALEHRPQVIQMHLNRRRFFQFFTGTVRTGSNCLVHFQIISEHFQSISNASHQLLSEPHTELNPGNPLDSPAPFHIILTSTQGVCLTANSSLYSR